MKAGYVARTEGTVALAAATVKSVLGVKSGATFGLDLKKLRVAFHDSDATELPVLIELCRSTWATNSPGTNSTSVTPAQGYGLRVAHGITAAKNWTSEPTALTVIEDWELTPAGGVVIYDLPVDQSYDCDVAEGFVLRLTAPSITDVRALLGCERC